MKKYIIGTVSVCLIILIVGGIFFWRYTKSPKYSLLQAKKAYQEHDMATFEKYVDVEGITNNLIDQMLNSSTKQKPSDNEFDQIGESIGKGLVMLLKPQLAKMAKQQITKLVETGKIEEMQENDDSDDPNFSLSNIWDKAGGDSSGYRGIDSVTIEGKISYVGLRFYQKDYDSELILKLKMRNMGDYWQVAELSNFAEYMDKIDDLETQRIDRLNAPILETLKRTLIIENIQKDKQVDDWGISKKIIWSIKVRNAGKKEIDEYAILLVCNNSDGHYIASFPLKDEENIMPGQKGGGIWANDVNMFDKNDNQIFETAQSRLALKSSVQYIKFSDGSEIKLHSKK